MLARLVTCDVVEEGGARMPCCAAMGIPAASVIGNGGPLDPGWCLSLAMANDLAMLDTCANAIRLFQINDLEQADLLALMDRSPVELEWTQGQITWLHDRILERGGDISTVGPERKLWDHAAILTALLGAAEADLRHLLAG